MFEFFTRIITILLKPWKAIKSAYKSVYLHTADFANLVFGTPMFINEGDLEAEEKKYINTMKFIERDDFYWAIVSFKYFKVDKREYKSLINFLFLNKNNIKIIPRFYYRTKHYYTNNTYKFDYFFFKKMFKNHVWFGLSSIWKAIRMWILSVFLLVISIYFLSLVRVLPVNTVLFQWFALGMFSYWLISGFVFFIKKYRFTRFTSSIQRFWRRSYILFWLIESCLLVVFIYLTLNSTQETSYMLDQISVFKNHLFSWRAFLPKLVINTILVILGYLLLLNVKWNIFKKNIPFVLTITVLLTYMLWVEFYQIYHVSNFYANLFWSYDVDERLWSLESDVRRTRIANHYVMILFLLKFWHIVFIYAFWIFFVLRASELERIRYPIYSANFQNFIILYIMAWLFMYPWIKVISQKFLSTPYFWFYVNNRTVGLRIFFYDIKLVLYSLQNYIFFNNFQNFSVKDFFYWTLSTENNNFENFRKHTIKNMVIKNLSNV